MFSKHLCYKAHMSLRDTLLLNIQHHMKRRSINNMTELARLSGVPQSVLSRFETGKHESIVCRTSKRSLKQCTLTSPNCSSPN